MQTLGLVPPLRQAETTHRAKECEWAGATRVGTARALAHRAVASVAIGVVCLVAPIAGASDLEITHIARDPKYEKYLVLYMNQVYTDDFTPYEVDSAVGLDNPGVQRWPSSGENVTFTAHVLNRGAVTIDAFDYAWFIDGILVDGGQFSGTLAPGVTTGVSLHWIWQVGRHTVGFRADLSGDETPANNELTDFTDALSLFTVIEQSYDDDFRSSTSSVPNPRTSFMTEWLQNHIKRYNRMLEEAGSPSRIRYDELSVVPDGSRPNGCSTDCKYYDGAFPQVFYSGDDDLRLGGSSYYDPNEDLDYGLLHELGHQLGLIDVYRLNLTAAQNKVNSLGYAAPSCLMNRVSHFVGEHTGMALDSWHNYRRGYFGQYLYDVPAANTLFLEDVCRQSLPGATINVYQKIQRSSGEEELPNIVKFSGTTDSGGFYTMPNVSVDTTNFPATETGNELRPNPFGYISNHGENGLFMLEVQAGGDTSFQFLSIQEFNRRYWEGSPSSATYPVATGILPSADPTDVARLVPASADIPSYISGWCGMTTPSVPGNGNDGDMGTVWCRDNVAPGDYWEVDLEAPKHPHRVVMYSDYRAFRCEGSLTGEFAGEQTLLFRKSGPLVNNLEPQVFTFYPKPARFLRITIEENQDWVKHREFEVYGGAGPCWSGPMDVPPDSVRLDKAGAGQLKITWGETCGLADDFTIYEGNIHTLAGSGIYDHTTLICSDQGERLTETFPPSPGSHYYLVVPRQSDGTEGGYGANRPQGTDTAACGITTHQNGECP